MRISRDGTKLGMKRRTESLWLRPLSWTEQRPLEKGKSPGNDVTGDYTLSITDGGNPTLSVYTKGTAAATGKAHQQLKKKFLRLSISPVDIT